MSWPVTLYTSPRARRLHRYADCTPNATSVLSGVVRESECSGPYAVQSDPPHFVLGDICRRCQARYHAAAQ